MLAGGFRRYRGKNPVVWTPNTRARGLSCAPEARKWYTASSDPLAEFPVLVGRRGRV